jgi:hypothetical protein
MAMSDTNVFQVLEIDFVTQAGLTFGRGRAGVEERQPTVQFNAVEVNLTNYVGCLYGVLAHGAPIV